MLAALLVVVSASVAADVLRWIPGAAAAAASATSRCFYRAIHPPGCTVLEAHGPSWSRGAARCGWRRETHAAA